MNLLAKTAIVFLAMVLSFCATVAAAFRTLVWLDSFSTHTFGGAFVFFFVPPICGIVGAFANGALTNHFLRKR